MGETQIRYKTLTYAGATPFIASALALILGLETLFGIITIEQLLSTYGLLILSFLAGINWGQHLTNESPIAQQLPLISNAVALAGWFAFLVLGFHALMVFFALAFLFQLAVDWRLYREALITPDYFRMRLLVSALVVASLLAAGLWG